MNTTPSTELEAINEMLAVIGESPVSTLEDNGVVDAALAKQTLASVSRSIQSKGWHFNTEIEYVLSPTFPHGYIELPLNTLRVDSVAKDINIDVVQRGQRLYDRREHSYTFLQSLVVDLVVMLDFSELPEPARYYITIRAARIFQERAVGSQLLTGFTERDEMLARVNLLDHDGESADNNILTDNFTVANILRR